MIKHKQLWKLLILISAIFLAGCKKDDTDSGITFSDDFESGSIGQVNIISDTALEIYLADDNDNAELPDAWRSWWYVKLSNISTKSTTEITVKNEGWPYYYIPVYSYNQSEWFRFTEDEVTQDTTGLSSDEIGELVIRKQFEQSQVWVARFYPYTLSDLETFLHTIERSTYVSISTPGLSQEGNPMYLLKITDPSVATSAKKRIFMHARTHPAETPPSFVIEGMVNSLLSGSQEAAAILSAFEFYIFPMQNVDGVVAGNYRSTPKSENLEVMWYYDSANTVTLTDESPLEVQVIHDYAVELMQDGGPKISMALNLHASNSEPDVCPFFYPHFGPATSGYSATESSLWNQQTAFIYSVVQNTGSDMIEPITEDGGSSFASKTYPESWWWKNYQDSVLAMTMEMTYGRSGYSHWIVPDDLRNLGEKVVSSIYDYYESTSATTSFPLKSAKRTGLKYPELYAPTATDEMKE